MSVAVDLELSPGLDRVRELARDRIAPLEGLPPFAGGAVGMFGYDLVRSAEPTVGPPNPDEVGIPDLALMITDVLLAFDHLRHEVTLLANVFAGEEDRSGAGDPRPLAHGELPGRGVLDLPRPARDQPEPVHVLPGLRGLPGGGSVARVARQGGGTQGRAAPDRRHPPAHRLRPRDRGR